MSELKKDLTEVIDEMYMRMLAHEAILRSLVLKVAGEHTLTPNLRAEWIKDLSDHINTISSSSVECTPEDKKFMVISMNADMKPHLDRFFKPMI
ncbi:MULTISPECIES: hypothetical protein [Methylobacterium]|uniref:Uncharacterized protein n=2 Tax=Methylobacterium TaxID=407 RepID=A0A0C6FNT7_9HYPH|nr:hypothetical protein [Methylobacterium aquaticum]BAQ44255.1 hypothetical protein Maq22A_c04150 [Methylobacterium aquaticum]